MKLIVTLVRTKEHGWIPLECAELALPQVMEIVTGIPFLFAMTLPQDIYSAPPSVPLDAEQLRKVTEAMSQVTEDLDTVGKMFADETPYPGVEVRYSDRILSDEEDATLVNQWNTYVNRHQLLGGGP